MTGKWRLAAAVTTITGLGLLSLAGTAGASAARPAAPRPAVRTEQVTSAGVTATVKIRGDWKLSHVKLPRTHLASPKVLHTAAARRAGSATSGNWSGFVDVPDKGNTFRFVTANFNVPNLNCTNSVPGSSGAAYFSGWTGLDGWADGTVEQQGIESYCSGSTQGLWVFYEMYPAAPVVFSGAHPGDAIQVSTYYSASTKQYQLIVKDITEGGDGVSVEVKCASTCNNSSAEVVSEAPGGGPPAYGLADFGAVSYTNAGVTTQAGTHGVLTTGSLWNGYSVKMVASGTGDTLATTGPLQGGTAFLSTWNAST
jgi:hypothetical protein